MHLTLPLPSKDPSAVYDVGSRGSKSSLEDLVLNECIEFGLLPSANLLWEDLEVLFGDLRCSWEVYRWWCHRPLADDVLVHFRLCSHQTLEVTCCKKGKETWLTDVGLGVYLSCCFVRLRGCNFRLCMLLCDFLLFFACRWLLQSTCWLRS